MTHKFNLFIFLILFAFISILWALLHGNTSISFQELIQSLQNKHHSLNYDILMYLRMPRVLSGFVVGGLLALAGALMQILLRNPLADPYVLGVSGGAAVATLFMLLLGLQGIMLKLGAACGGLAAIFILFFLAGAYSNFNNHRTLLTGIACASGFSAIISFILLVTPDKALHGMLFWLMGDLSYSHPPVFEGGFLMISLLLSLILAPQLTLFLRGEREAHALGIHVQYLKIILYFLSSALTATAVMLAGCIGFVGLIVPHFLRLIGLHDPRLLLPSAVLLGGSLLTIADSLARTLCDPLELPVGIVMALLGVPVFLWLLSATAK